jgi:hypothetical protein
MPATQKRRILVSKNMIIYTLKATFNGYTYQGSIEYALVNFQVDTNYACDIFQSCEKESFISQADITSSLAFMDFLGVNGENQSLSIITFSFSNDTETSLGGEAYSCAYVVPPDGILPNGYEGIYNSTCSYCAEVC